MCIIFFVHSPTSGHLSWSHDLTFWFFTKYNVHEGDDSCSCLQRLFQLNDAGHKLEPLAQFSSHAHSNISVLLSYGSDPQTLTYCLGACWVLPSGFKTPHLRWKPQICLPNWSLSDADGFLKTRLWGPEDLERHFHIQSIQSRNHPSHPLGLLPFIPSCQ